MDHNSYKIVSRWLYCCAGLVFIMVIVGAITRLTESGLSMVEWQPLIGAIPPLTEAEWERVFHLYQQSPEFIKKNFWMSMDDFKAIFFWEWFHRLLGRLIGIAYALPLAYFWLRKSIPQGMHLKLLALLFLGAAQGALGWYMVKSGLVNEPAVSHYRLAAHLSLALVLYSLLLWMGLSINPPQKSLTVPKALKTHLWIVLISVTLTTLWGALTAGLDAGLVYNETFPMMGDQWIPDDLEKYDPFWLGIIETHGGVQFFHRWLAMITALIILSFWFHAYKKQALCPSVNFLMLMVFVQIALGISTLLSKVALPLAALHQSGALIILTLIIVTLRRYYSYKSPSSR